MYMPVYDKLAHFTAILRKLTTTYTKGATCAIISIILLLRLVRSDSTLPLEVIEMTFDLCKHA